jgi:hypothetical protein
MPAAQRFVQLGVNLRCRPSGVDDDMFVGGQLIDGLEARTERLEDQQASVGDARFALAPSQPSATDLVVRAALDETEVAPGKAWEEEA